MFQVLIIFSPCDDHPNPQYGRASDGGPGEEGDTVVDVVAKKKGILKKNGRENGSEHTVTFVTAKELLKEDDLPVKKKLSRKELKKERKAKKELKNAEKNAAKKDAKLEARKLAKKEARKKAKKEAKEAKKRKRDDRKCYNILLYFVSI